MCGMLLFLLSFRGLVLLLAGFLFILLPFPFCLVVVLLCLSLSRKHKTRPCFLGTYLAQEMAPKRSAATTAVAFDDDLLILEVPTFVNTHPKKAECAADAAI